MGINLRLAFKALACNRLQALLTLSGMSFGVAMVVIVSGLGSGAQQRIEAQIEAAGPTLITLRSGNLRPAAIVTSGEQDTSGGEVSEGALPATGLDGTQDVVGNSAIDDARQRAIAPRQTKYRSPPTPLGDAELDLIRHRIAGVKAVSGGVEGNLSVEADAQTPVRTVRLVGFEQDLPDMQAWRLVAGRLPTASEHRAGEPVAVVSQAAAQRLWPGADPTAQRLLLGATSLRVVGLIATPKAEAAGGVVPVVQTTLGKAVQLLQRDGLDSIRIRTRSVAVTSQALVDIKAALRGLHQLPQDTLDDFRLESQSVSAMPSMGMDPRLARSVHSNVVGFEQASWEEMSKSLRQAGRIFTLLLAGAAAVSLLVGGIGVMNIMLVSVTARTREIGLRMAMGARMRDVLSQFLVEAVALAAAGGAIGLALGLAVLFVARHGLQWAAAVSPLMLLLGIGMAAATGVVFGYGPARRAAALDPVVALKAE